MKKRTKRKLKKIFSIIFCSLIYLFLFAPIIYIVANSFNATRSKPYLSWKGFSLDWYVKLFDNQTLLQSFGNTMIIAITSMILATIIGTLASVGMYKFKFKGKAAIDGLLYIPVVIPEIVLGIALLTLFSNINIPRGMLTLIIAHTTFCVPFVIFNVRARLGGYDMSIEEASMDLGAGRIRTFFEITLPVLAPGIGGGALLAFTLSIDDVIISYFVNGQTKTFPLKVYESIRSGVAPDVNALSTLILIGTTVLVILTQSGLIKKLLNKIEEKLLKLKDNVKVYDSDSPKNSLISGDCTVGYCWAAEIALAQEENPDIKIVFPKEGPYVFMDNWAVLKTAKNSENAMKFINYMLDSETSQKVSEEFPYLNPNAKAVEELGDEYKSNEAKNPPADVIASGEYVSNLDTDTLAIYDAMWTKLKK